MRIKGIDVTIGCDPEFFLRKNGVPESAHFLIDKFGGKHNPLKLDHGAVQVDGTAVEFNTDPANTPEEFVERVDKVLLQIRDRITDDFEFNFYPVTVYSDEQFSMIPEFAKELGCDPDYDAYTLAANPKPDVQSHMRTGSGHIHVGWTNNIDVESEEAKVNCAALVKQLDAVLYPASLLWDYDSLRRNMYGKPGAFRVKPYGVEYRVLSNAWLKHREVQKWICQAVFRAFELLMEGVILPKASWEKLDPKDVVDIWKYVNTELGGRYGFPRLTSRTFMG